MKAIDVLSRYGEERTAKIHKALRELTEAIDLSTGDCVDFSATFKVSEYGDVTMHSISLTHSIPSFYRIGGIG